MQSVRKNSLRHSAMLLLTSIIWGFAFVAQSVGAAHVGPLTFIACRGLLAMLVLTPFVWVVTRRQIAPGGGRRRESGRALLRGGILCGSFLFLGMALQQLGIAYTTVGKSGFITTTYVVMVPLLGILLGRHVGLRIWAAVVLCVTGLYLLSMQPGEFSLSYGDTITLLCALAFTLQITAVDYFVERTDPVLLSFAQQIIMTVLAIIGAFVIESPDIAAIRQAAIPILYAGIFSSGAGLTMQTIGQRGVNPSAAALIMSLESCFSVLGGWLILHQVISLRELCGCALMFAAIVLSQIVPKSEQNV